LFIFDILPKNCICAEVGTWKGEFSQKILNHLNPKKLYLIDPWKYEPSYNCSWYGGGGEAKNQEAMDDIYDSVIEKFASNYRVKILAMSSIETSKLFSNNYFDFVYIDACHLYEFILQDLKIWYPKIKLGGFLTGDDYNVPNSWWKDGITKAVNEFIEENKLKLSTKNNQFLIRKENKNE